MQITALHNQSLLDVAIRHYGTVGAVADIAILNNISITQDLVPGQMFEIPNTDYSNQEVINYFSINKADPATGVAKIDLETITPKLGIGTMRIGTTFIVG
jgi:hypothetical protein